MLNFGEKMLMSAELKGCVTWFMHFLGLLWVRYNGAKFHQCKICVTDFREWRPFWSPPHSWAAPKRPILNRVNNIIIPNNNVSAFFIQIRLLLSILTFSTLEKLGMMMGAGPTFWSAPHLCACVYNACIFIFYFLIVPCKISKYIHFMFSLTLIFLR